MSLKQATRGITTNITNVWLHFCYWRESAPCVTSSPYPHRRERAQGLAQGFLQTLPVPPSLAELPAHPACVSVMNFSHGDSDVLSPMRASSGSLEVWTVLGTPQTGPHLSSRVHNLQGTLQQHCINLLNCSMREVMFSL